MDFQDYDKPAGKLIAFGYADVKVSEGAFFEAYEECYRYYMAISVDDMLFELRKRVGIANPPAAKTLAGEKGTWYGLGGNVLGQWLQAYARFYAATKRQEVKDKADALVAGLREVTGRDAQLGDGLFMYFLEKYVRGFLDCYVYCENEDAFAMAQSFVRMAMGSPVYTAAKKRLGDNGTMPVPAEIEWYTISESLYRYADIAELRNEREEAEKVRAFAKGFEYPQFWDIFYEGKNLFDYSPLAGQNTAYFHSYSHLNSFNSAAYAYQKSQDPYYLKSIVNFYRFMREKQELMTGGYGPHLEWLMPRTGMINALEFFHDSFETQCCSYAVYRLSDWLMEVTGDAAYGNWPEKLLYNATLASIPMDEAGYVQYYSDLNTDHACKHLHENTWTCCTGTRPLLMNELLRSVYFHRGNDLYVNLYIPSSLDFCGMRVRLKSEYPRGGRVTLCVEKGAGKRKIAFRRPESAASFSVHINGREEKCPVRDGWIFVERAFADGDEIALDLETMPVWSRLEVFGEGVAGLCCGPVALASASSADEVLSALDVGKEAAPQLEKIGPLQYRAKGSDVLFTPYMDYPKGEIYRAYFRYGGKA